MRGLIAASLAALSMSGAYADELAPVPSAADENPQGTLDKLAGQNIPNTDPVQTYPEAGSAYTLTKVQEGGEKPEGDNIITKFTYDTESKTMTPVYYRLDLKQTTYGEGDSSKTFMLTTEPVKGVEITAKYNDLSDKSYDTEYKDNNYEATVTSGGSYSNPKKEIHSALQNPEGDTISIDNAIFKDNSTVINFTQSYSYLHVLGGAIYNAGTIESITADFVNNSVTGNTTYSYLSAYGGAIYNSGTISDITGNFIGNYASSSSSAYGGAIYNEGKIGDITGDFIGNCAYAYGGAIYNEGEIGDITGDFIGNYTNGDGGAIYNDGTIVNITGNFIGNYASASSSAFGGAIHNERTIGDITGDFIGNYASVNSKYSSSYGGAIYNTRTIGAITGDFIGNYASSSSSSAYGGAIYNNGEIGDITGDFIGNYASSSNRSASGGAIYNSGDGTIAAITGDFIGNYASANSEASGGAIYNSGNGIIGDITGDFIGNYAESTNSTASGGAIYNNNEIGNITGNFISNYVSSKSSAAGGAIANIVLDGSDAKAINLDSIKGDFINNHAESVSSDALGGAIYNVTGYDAYYATVLNTIDAVQGDFIGNYVKSTDGRSAGGAIYTTGEIKNIENSSFINNYAVSQNGQAQAGAVYSADDLTISANKGYTSVFDGNYVEVNGVRENNAIFMATNEYRQKDSDGAPEYLTIQPSNLTLSATDNGTIIMNDKISGQNGYTATKTTYSKEEQKNIVETLGREENKPWTLALTGDKTGTIQLNNDVDAINEDGSEGSVDIQLSEVNLHLAARDNVIDNNNLTLNSGSINMINNQVGVSALNSMTVNGDTNMMADVDLANETMDRFTANNYGEHKGNLNVVGMNLLSDAPEDREVTDIYFAQIGLKDHVTNGMGELPDGYQTTAYTPIYKYHVMYDNRDDGGYFMFTKGDNIFRPTPGGQGGIGGGGITTTPTGNPSDAFNPAILSSPVAAQAGAYAAQNAAFTYAFTHADTFMPLPSADRFALRNANKYALTSYDSLALQMNDLHEKGMWVRPYTSFESIPLDNGPKVDTITYGTFIGGDSDFKELKNGWGTVFTGYVGYNGSNQHYSGVDTYQNGGLLGVTQTFYKGNFFTALTASVGASAGESHNMYGTDNFAMLMAGVASKSGYNIEFKDGRFIIQPSLMLSYSFINTFDYKTASGVTMDSDPMHAIQINPNVKFIANLKNGWQPYASVGMVWNLLDGTNVRANTVRLPEMSIKPYVEYGLGVQKRWKDKFTGYAQAMVRNGGRNGVALTAGFRWALGKDGAPIPKVDAGNISNIKKAPVFKLSSMGLTPSTSEVASGSDKGILNQVQNDRNAANEEILKRVQDDRTVRNDKISTTAGGKKIIKQLSPAQKTALGAKPQNTTRTTTVGVLKQL